MATHLAALSAVLPDAPPDAVRASLPLWGIVLLRPGALLWKQGRAADAMGILAGGELDEAVDGLVIGAITVGQSFGESAMFAPTGQRPASIRARVASRVFVLPSTGIARLRAQGSPLYRVLLDHAITDTAARGQEIDRHLAQVRRGGFAEPPPTEPSGMFSRFWRRVTRTGADPKTCPPLGDLLASDPIFAKAAPEVQEAIVRAFTPKPFRAGAALIRQGDEDTRVFVLADGGADVLRTIESDGSALLLGSLTPGTPFGINAFTREPRRSSSVVATSDGWYWSMTREAFDQLPPAAHTTWYEICLAVYIRQYSNAAHELQRAIQVFSSQEDELIATNPMHDPARFNVAALRNVKRKP
jgi:CRP-like cAMP-binding protein